MAKKNRKYISVLLTTASFRCIVNQVDQTLCFCLWPIVITHPVTIPYTLAPQRMGQGPAALASTRSILQTQNLGWGHSRPSKSELTVSPDHRQFCMNIKDWEVLPHLLSDFIPILSKELSLPGILEEMVGLRHTEKQIRILCRWWKNRYYSWLLSFPSPGSSLQYKAICRSKKEALWYPQGRESINWKFPKELQLSWLLKKSGV